jgi:SHS family lactate transporter-like MFS transporter
LRALRRARSIGFVYHVGAFAAALIPTAVAALNERSGLSLGRSIAYVTGACNLALVAAMLLRPRAAAVAVEAEAPNAAPAPAPATHH